MKSWNWLAALLLLSACASANLEGIKPGSITLEQMRAREKPTAEWPNQDGTVTLEYADRPGTQQNVMMDFNSKGLLTDSYIVITQENLVRIRIGMTRQEVKRILGTPNKIWRNQPSVGEVWEWPLDSKNQGDPQSVILVIFHPSVDAVTRVARDNRFP
ncbi:outer membrane protein assembly factor BamE domain-containing protein [Uliginosibacterium aquaticum]|uniref:Outer membrane protein assembly factor BamE n=1 Tax=Uliginosibacterium aquaticum TaxID=2731212 RepID=A0ABX2IG11_9RHOO|nr:outer membrane protein assembly factor BamE [Uliginosibacterium aquaticum]NSL55641.1 outer membrane protein assembly factor BamE [Uliginosibacterium aquaticum]